MNLEPSKTKQLTTSKADIELLQRKQHEYKLIGKVKKVSGHTMFSYNIQTGEIKVADVERCDTILFTTKKPLVNEKIKVEPNCIYEQALNKKNFVKKLRRMGIEVVSH